MYQKLLGLYEVRTKVSFSEAHSSPMDVGVEQRSGTVHFFFYFSFIFCCSFPQILFNYMCVCAVAMYGSPCIYPPPLSNTSIMLDPRFKVVLEGESRIGLFRHDFKMWRMEKGGGEKERRERRQSNNIHNTSLKNKYGGGEMEHVLPRTHEALMPTTSLIAYFQGASSNRGERRRESGQGGGGWEALREVTTASLRCCSILCVCVISVLCERHGRVIECKPPSS